LLHTIKNVRFLKFINLRYHGVIIGPKPELQGLYGTNLALTGY
jgi:hypothetical protein